MATKHFNSGAGGTGSGDDWTNAYTSVEDYSASAGDILLIHYTHTENKAGAINWTLDGSPDADNPILIISVDKDNSDAYRAGAMIDVQTGATYAININAAQNTIVSIGVDYSPHGNFQIENDTAFFMRDGLLYQQRSGNYMGSSAANTVMDLEDVQLRFSFNTNELRLSNGSILRMKNVSFHASSTAVNDLVGAVGDGSNVEMIGCDLTGGIASGGNLIGDGLQANSGQGSIRVYIAGCEWDSTTDIGNQNLENLHTSITIHNSGSGTTHFQQEYKHAYGDVVEDRANYVTNSLSQLGDGTLFSYEITPQADEGFGVVGVPLRLGPFYAAADETLRVQVAFDNATELTDADLWTECWYPKATGPQYGVDHQRDTTYGQGTATNLLNTASAAWTISPAMTNEKRRHIDHDLTGLNAAGPHWIDLYYAPGATTPVLYVSAEVERV